MEYHDLTLRDGNHAVKHQLSEHDISKHCIFAENARISVVEVGHGNGLGASSLLIGKSRLTDHEMITTAKKYLKNTKLSVHAIPGIATIKRDIDPAIDLGVDIFRVASHCTEANVTQTYIQHIVNKGKQAYGVLMMAALCSTERLVQEAYKMKTYGASAIIIMDSTGSLNPDEVSEKIQALQILELPIGFHGHNNLHYAVANSISAIKSGAKIIDTTIKGFGAGAGNTPLEIMISLTPSHVDVQKVLEYCERSEFQTPISKPINILTAKHKLFSGFENHIIEACKKHNISLTVLVEYIASKNIVAGQEDIIRVSAAQLSSIL
jgi:4-hydroxy 2-oxovalerate aldolase